MAKTRFEILFDKASKNTNSVNSIQKGLFGGERCSGTREGAQIKQYLRSTSYHYACDPI